MDNIDVSRASFFSEFPTLIEYQTVSFSFNIASYSASVLANAAESLILLYEAESSAPIDKSNGIAHVLVGYSGGEQYVFGTPDEFFSYKLQVKGSKSDWYESSLDPNGKNSSGYIGLGQLPGSTTDYFGFNIFNWFDNQRIYTKIQLYRHNRGAPSITRSFTWAGGTVTTEAKVSLLPY